MNRRVFGALLLLSPLPGRGEADIEAILNRVSEEAEVFQQRAKAVVCTETLRQKSRKNPSRFKLRTGSEALKPPAPKFQSREIISEFSFTTVADAPDSLLELRQIVSVDGRKVAGHHKARETLTLGIRNNDDRAKKKMLQRFQRHGLKGAATDFGQVILLFERDNLKNYTYSFDREARLGADEAIVVRFEQKVGPESFTIFKGREAKHVPLQGEIWVRGRDYLPLRVVLETTQEVDGGKHLALHTGVVDYQRSGHGVVLPASVRYSKKVDGELLVENRSEYTNFQRFAVETEIRFTPSDEPLEGPTLAEPPG